MGSVHEERMGTASPARVVREFAIDLIAEAPRAGVVEIRPVVAKESLMLGVDKDRDRTELVARHEHIRDLGLNPAQEIEFLDRDQPGRRVARPGIGGGARPVRRTRQATPAEHERYGAERRPGGDSGEQNRDPDPWETST